ncbi:hypothetical protein [Tenacibaculum ovolyticum]|uniref:hypothetical protein n=1 Tax=Tenacibaculum ovolyticum TaxID=104270 RepID=UPI001F19752E|nr:hypothetical protein [Tenacibaculum ovolyticum]
MKEVFPTQKNTDSSFIFSIDTIEKIENNKGLYCNEVEGKNQFIRIKLNDLPINLFFVLYCRAITFCPKDRNTIWLEGDFKEDKTFFEDSQVLKVKVLENYLHNQFLNLGKDPMRCDNPNKNLIIIRYRNFEKKSKERISKALDTISVSYFNFIKSFQKQNIDSLKIIYPLQILLEPDFRSFDVEGNIINHKPPPPAPIEIVE